MNLPVIPFPQPQPDLSLRVEVRKRYAAGHHSGFQLDVAFSAPPGVTIVLGHSGAGKTTLLRSIAGLCNPEKGRISVAGRVLFDSEKRLSLEPARRKMAFVFQDLALFPHLTVFENVCYGLRNLKAAERERRVAEVLESFQIANLRKRLPREISGGEQQRVALARSLVTEPSVLLLDEPLSSLDTHTKADIIDDLRAWNHARQIPMLYVTHNHEEVFALGEKVLLLVQGRIVAEGAPADVVKAPRRHSMAHIAGFENLFDASVVEVREKQGVMVCRLAETSIEIRTPLTRVKPHTPIHLGIRADEILLSSAKPEIIGDCNLIQGKARRIESAGTKTAVRIDCGVEFQVEVPSDSLGHQKLKPHDDAWLIINPHSCHLIHSARLRASQRLFVFICNRNTSRSPIAEAICNAEIARRLRVSRGALKSVGVCAVSAGLSATPGDSMLVEAQRALDRLKVPVHVHSSHNLTTELAARAELIFCMTESQRQRVMEMFPESAPRVFCLQAGEDIEDPHGQDEEAFEKLARQIQGIIRPLIDTLLPVEGLRAPYYQKHRDALRNHA